MSSCLAVFAASPVEGGESFLPITTDVDFGETGPFQFLVDKESLSMALDSGANGMVFFRMPSAMASSPRTVGMLTGIPRSGATALVWTRNLVVLRNLHVASVPAAVIDGEGREIDGLLPACIFRQVFVDWLRHEAVLVR